MIRRMICPTDVLNYVVTYLLKKPELEEEYSAMLFVSFVLLPSHAFTIGILSHSRNYWARQLCGTNTQLIACALGAVDQCCRGNDTF